MIRLLILLYMYTSYIFAQSNIIEDPKELYDIPLLGPTYDDEILATKISVRRTFYSIDELSQKLNTIDGITVKILNKSSLKPSPVPILINNGTIVQLLNQSIKKLDYTWEIKNHEIILSAIHPITQIAVSAYSTPKMKTVPLWVISPEDKTLRNSLIKWCRQSGWQLVWNAHANYAVDTNWSINSSFESAVNEVLSATQYSEIPLMAVMYDSNHVLEIYSTALSK
ncbi:MAG: toxin co-regulated pilus biosynthesis Q family protein [Burkholderiales bacterium]|nr:toxin co-regulated pilus biosynthesis Q family protein [Burkholderiales bacterium]